MKPYLLLLFAIFFFTARQASSQTNDLLQNLKSKPEKLKASASDLSETTISHQYTDERFGITYVYLQQWHKGIRVYNGVMSLALKKEEVVSAQHSFISNLAKRAGNTTAPKIPAQEALLRTASHLKLALPKESKLLSAASGG